MNTDEAYMCFLLVSFTCDCVNMGVTVAVWVCGWQWLCGYGGDSSFLCEWHWLCESVSDTGGVNRGVTVVVWVVVVWIWGWHLLCEHVSDSGCVSMGVTAAKGCSSYLCSLQNQLWNCIGHYAHATTASKPLLEKVIAQKVCVPFRWFNGFVGLYMHRPNHGRQARDDGRWRLPNFCFTYWKMLRAIQGSINWAPCGWTRAGECCRGT